MNVRTIHAAGSDRADAGVDEAAASIASGPNAYILVVDDDPIILNFVRLHLASADFEVEAVPGVAEAMAAIEKRIPDLIISDISMPQVDGFDFLTQLRSNARTENVPFIFLTQHTDRAAMRRGMQLGANDFLSKPIRRPELLSAISEGLRLLEGVRQDAGAGAPRVDTDHMKMPAEKGRSQTPLPAVGPRTTSPVGTRTVVGTVLFLRIANFADHAERLTAAEVAELLNAYFAAVCEPILAQQGWIVKFLGDGLIAMFDDEGDGKHHQVRGLKATLLAVVATQQFQSWIENRFSGKTVTAVAMAAGIEAGLVTLDEVNTAGNREIVAGGDAAALAKRLEETAMRSGWSVAAGAAVLREGGGRFVTARATHVRPDDPDGVFAEARELVELLPRDGGTRTANLGNNVYTRIREAVLRNSSLVAGTRHPSSPLIVDDAMPLSSGESQLNGFRLLHKLGEGGMSTVFLAENLAAGEKQVLKLLRLDKAKEGDLLQRFIAEFALISQIDHPNVARIHAQGFSESFAYIAMEYFPGGDLRQIIDRGTDEAIAVAAILQVAGALSAIHDRGIVHRDLKPENIMVRADGSLALADFGIATQQHTLLVREGDGDVYGTPSYISPEQATGGKVDHRADIYALGIMFHELLTGKKPYRAPTPQSLLDQHINGPLPILPAELFQHQPVLDSMLAKSPHDRFNKAEHVIEALLVVTEPQL